MSYGKSWTPEEDAILRENWGTELPISMWALPGRTCHAIRNRAILLGLGGRSIRMQVLYPQVSERAEKILELLRAGPMTSVEIRNRLDMNKFVHRRAHDRIRDQIYIFAWKYQEKGGPQPIWAIGNAKDARRPPKVDPLASAAKYREKNRKQKAKTKARADISASWMFNPVS